MINTNFYNANTYKPNFKGLDASKPLKALHILPSGKFDNGFINLMNELQAICKKEKIQLVCQNMDGFVKDASKLKINEHIGGYSWFQDVCMQLPENRLFYRSCCCNDTKDIDKYAYRLSNYLKKTLYRPESKLARNFWGNNSRAITDKLVGGNIYQMRNKFGYRCVLVGKDCEKNLDMHNTYELFRTNDITFVPQADFHIDLFVRPLKNGKILVADDIMSFRFLKYIEDNLDKFPNMTSEKALKFKKFVEKSLKNIKKVQQNKHIASTEEVVKVLTDKNYEVVRVPGRFFEVQGTKKEATLFHNANYINSIVQQREDGTLAYITNKSDPMYTGGIRLDNLFAKYLKKVCPEIKDVYFISGDNMVPFELKKLHGGMHCRVMEEVENL